MRPIIENVKHKNIKGLETLANKYFKQFLSYNDSEALEKAVIAKALSMARTLNYKPSEIEELFDKDEEIILIAKEYFSKILHDLGFTYVRISEMLKIDIFDIVNRVKIKESDKELPKEIYLDPSALVSLGKMCFLDVLDFFSQDITFRGWLESRDIRRFAIERSKVNFVVFENKSYDPVYFVGGKPVHVFSQKEIEFVEKASFLVTNDESLLCLDRCPKERIEKMLNKAVLIYPDGLERIKSILDNTTIITVGEFISIAKKRGFDAKIGNETILID